MNKKPVKTKILWIEPSTKKRIKLQGKIDNQAQAGGGDCKSPCPCKCDDYY